MADNDGNGDAGAGGAPQTPAKSKKAPEAEPEKLKDVPRFRVRLLTNAIIDGEAHMAGQVIEVTVAQANWLERSGTILPDD